MKNKIKFLKKDFYVSRWVVLAIDLLIVLSTFVITYFIRFNFSFAFKYQYFEYQIPIVLGVSLIVFLLVGSYRGIIRLTGIKDAINVFIATSVIFLLLSSIVLINRRFDFVNLKLPLQILVIHYLLNVVTLIGSRYVYKQLYYTFFNTTSNRINVLIYGAGDSGLATYGALIQDSYKKYYIKGFIDDNKTLKGKNVKGLPVFDGKKINKKLIQSHKIDEIIISIQNIDNQKLLKIVDKLLTLPVEVKTVPPVRDWINGTFKSQQIKDLKVEDLLMRSPINIFNESIEKSLRGKSVMVTGAAGSIGSEISRQLTEFSCENLILVDQAESALYELQMELNYKNTDTIQYVIADVSNRERLKKIFNKFPIDYIFHAAAYKHVPLMEDNPYEAVNVNIKGSRNLMDLAVEYGVEKFVMVSTDKAVNPTNVMGASKRVAELYALAKNGENKTKFVTTRFGNVLGSNGSVIPLFKKQIEKGGPLTVTHPEITRFFMTIPEACHLVLEAGIIGNGGEIYVFDMGESVKVFEIAKNMIRLSGHKYPEEIDIKVVGLRPGEKLYEEVLSNAETTLPTHHPKILIAKTAEIDIDDISFRINDLIDNMGENNELMVKKIKEIVPEYLSENSVYKSLDKIQQIEKK